MYGFGKRNSYLKSESEEQRRRAPMKNIQFCVRQGRRQINLTDFYFSSFFTIQFGVRIQKYNPIESQKYVEKEENQNGKKTKMKQKKKGKQKERKGKS